jgi:hypothetical protein
VSITIHGILTLRSSEQDFNNQGDKMNAETFFKHLDEIRSAARMEFGMKQQPVVFESKPVQQLIQFVEGLYYEGKKKHPEPKQVTEELLDTEQSVETVDHLAGLEPKVETTQPVETTVDEAPHTNAPVTSGIGPMTSSVLPRDPKPVHSIDVVEATENTVAVPDGGWQDGDS